MQKFPAWSFYLCAFEGVFALIALLSIPSERGNISPARLALLASILILIGLWIYLGLHHRRIIDELVAPISIFISALLALTFSLFLFFLRYLNLETLLPVYTRLSPLLWYLLVLSAQVAVFFLLAYKGIHPANLSIRKPVYFSALVTGCILFSVFVFISLTRLGLTPDPAYWGEPGVPMLGWQFGLALVGGLCVLIVSAYTQPEPLKKFLPFAVYATAVIIWLMVPFKVLTNSFYMPITPPTLQPLPYSDSIYYDQMAQSLLTGNSYLGEIPSRPLYITFLTFLHLLFGENYFRILAAQTVVLALMPVVLYFLGKKLHSRVAGTTIALFFIFRELTSLLISSDTRVTNTRMILVDLPTLFLLILTCLFVFRWLEKRNGLSAFLAGGMFGLLLLLRTQSLLIVPLIILVALLVVGWRQKSLYLQVAVFFSGLLISILPWLIHNYLLTGEVAFDAAFQYKNLASQYAYSGNLDIQNYDFKGKSLPSVLIEFTLRDPGFVFGFISNHFLATQINALLALPIIKQYNGIHAPINLYWMDWNGQLEWYNTLLLVLYLAVISLGLGAAWRRWRWIGLLPLTFSIGYALGTAIGRFSSWRYDYPADWIAYFYFGIGFAEILEHAALLIGAKIESSKIVEENQHIFLNPHKHNRILNHAVPALVFLLIGASPWLMKNIALPRYSDQSLQKLEMSIAQLPNAPAQNELQAFASQPNSFLQMGRLLYPRFFNRNDGLASANPSAAYAIRDYPRLAFLLLNKISTPAIFPTRDLPGPIPHAADVIVLGCWQENHVDVRLLALPSLETIYLSAPLTDPCLP